MATENSASELVGRDSVEPTNNGSYHALRATSRSHVKRIALGYAQVTRAHKFDRVSSSFQNAVEANALNFIKDRVKRHPSKGKTLM
jgi:hypothetical protein